MLGRSIYKAETLTASVIIFHKFTNNDEWSKSLMSEIIFDPVHKNVIFNLFQKFICKVLSLTVCLWTGM